MMSTVPFFYPYPLGVQNFEEKGKKGLFVSYASKAEICGIILFDRDTGEEIGRYPFLAENKVGNVYSRSITDVNVQKISYLFYEQSPKSLKLIPDQFAKGFCGQDLFGTLKGSKDYKAVVVEDTYNWGDDRCPMVPYEDCIVYCVHVRGFTMHASSGVKAKGTFKGIVEKIPYLKELGITTLELQPAYEFNELPENEAEIKAAGAAPLRRKENDKLNYWGYKEGFYYTPKRSYAKGKDACKEFKDMVKALHENGMEVVMQFYFPDTVPALEVLNILHFWHIKYHVDGFHLKGDHLPVKEAAEDAYLANCKLWYYGFPVDAIYANAQKPLYRNLAFYNDTYMNTVRRLLKGEEGVLKDAFKAIRLNSSANGVINYLTNYEGFTMADLFSYERKHNEANGENNQDGRDYNFSSNCGIEGVTQKKKVLALRQKQIRNAFAFLLLSQGTPLFFMGDEFGNSQQGNNNPYCQDNEVTWLNWHDLRKNRELFEYVKNLIIFRKEHSVFHMPGECQLMDYIVCGYPDLSYHGSEAWKPSFEPYSRHAGFMLCGEYAQDCKGNFYYVAVNMHEESHMFALPKLPQNERWKSILSTDLKMGFRQEDRAIADEDKNVSEADRFEIPAKTITVFSNLK